MFGRQRFLPLPSVFMCPPQKSAHLKRTDGRKDLIKEEHSAAAAKSAGEIGQ